MKKNKNDIKGLNNQFLATKLINQYFNIKEIVFFYRKKFNQLVNLSLYKSSRDIVGQLIDIMRKKGIAINEFYYIKRALKKLRPTERNILISYLYFNKTSFEIAKENNFTVRNFFRLINKSITNFLKCYHLEKVFNRF